MSHEVQFFPVLRDIKILFLVVPSDVFMFIISFNPLNNSQTNFPSHYIFIEDRIQKNLSNLQNDIIYDGTES